MFLFTSCMVLIRTLSSSVLVVLNEPRQAKVSDLTNQVISHQDVGRSQVSVDVVHPLYEGHAVCDLRGVRQERSRKQELRLRKKFEKTKQNCSFKGQKKKRRIKKNSYFRNAIIGKMTDLRFNPDLSAG